MLAITRPGIMHASVLGSVLKLRTSVSAFRKVLTPRSDCCRVTGYSINRLLQTSMPMGSHNDVRFHELRELLGNPQNVVIDVREKQELDEFGRIEGAHHIPLGEITQALQLEPAEFEAKYGFPKPQAYTKIIFSCRSGKRSLNACDLAKSQGFKNLWNYSGGFLDWSEHIKEK